MHLKIYMNGAMCHSHECTLDYVQDQLAGALTNLVQGCPTGSRVAIVADYGTIVYLIGVKNRAHEPATNYG